MQKNEVGPFLHLQNSLTKIKELHIRVTSTKLLEENIGKKLYNIGFGKHLLDRTSKA